MPSARSARSRSPTRADALIPYPVPVKAKAPRAAELVPKDEDRRGEVDAAHPEAVAAGAAGVPADCALDAGGAGAPGAAATVVVFVVRLAVTTK
ncbi:MAG TPA: hypothetical protein VNC61_11835 [Acidimicrobiales bacterium]|nr:hypothetical protein [Acidimicrobiales bacterium]